MAQSIADLVDEAVVLDRVIAEMQEKLKAHKKRLLAEARRRKAEPIEGGGLRVTFTGRDGHIARVVWPKDKLKAGIKGEGKLYDQLVGLAGDTFAYLFEEKPTTFRPAEDFRGKVQDLFDCDPATARKLIKLCTSKSSPTVSFETKPNPEHTS